MVYGGGKIFCRRREMRKRPTQAGGIVYSEFPVGVVVVSMEIAGAAAGATMLVVVYAGERNELGRFGWNHRHGCGSGCDNAGALQGGGKFGKPFFIMAWDFTQSSVFPVAMCWLVVVEEAAEGVAGR